MVMSQSTDLQLTDRQQTLTLKSNSSLDLHRSHQIWQVQSGTIALFAVPNQAQTGRRRYLFTLQAGEVMVSTQLADHTDYHLLAVALEPAQLVKRHATDVQSQLTHWLDQLGNIFDIAAPRLATTLESAHRGFLSAGDIFRSPRSALIWLRLLRGQAQFLGSPNLIIDPDDNWFPLPAGIWIESIAITEVEIKSDPGSKPLVNPAGIAKFHYFILQSIQKLEQAESAEELQRFQAREQLHSDAITKTLHQLSNVVHTVSSKPKAAQRLTIAPPQNPIDALLIAAGAVGHHLGIVIQPPATSEDLQRVKHPLESIARASRIRIRQVKLQGHWWQQDSGPLLAYTQSDDQADQQPIALLPVGPHRYEYYNPLTQQRGICNQSIANLLSPIAYTFYPPLPAELKPLSLIQFALKGRHREIIAILITAVAATLVGMVTPQATAILIDQAIPDANRALLLQLALGLAMTTFGATLFQFTQGLAIMHLETWADTTTQAAVWDRLLTLPTTFFRQYEIGDLSSRVSVISQIRQKVSSTVLRSLLSSLFSLLNLGLLFQYSMPLALIALVVAGINILVTVVSGLLTIKKMRPLLDRQGKLFGMMVQIINGVGKFRVAGAEPRAYAYWGQEYREQLQLTLSSQRIEDNLTVVNHLLSALTPAVLFATSAQLLTAENGLSTGTFLAFNAAFGTFISGATSLSGTAIDLLEVLPLWERAQPILQAKPEIDAEKANPGRLSGRIAIDHVVFRYGNDGPMTLDDVSIQADPGEFIALVGPSGSGKSTLFRLLLGFETPESGTVYYDGQDLGGLDITAVRRQCGVVLQHSRLMAGSIFDNIASNAVISLDEAWEAAQMSGLTADIQAMPMGMHTVVSEGGSNLSGGQRQRLLIARALALRPRILFFDEATSALDNRTQAIVSASLAQLKVTRVVVAHRLSTIRQADRIYVLDGGRLQQQGSFDQLAQQPGLFQQLIQRQRV
jgi:NHLM bacteriocin system ABC transporter ATP-binding protein